MRFALRILSIIAVIAMMAVIPCACGQAPTPPMSVPDESSLVASVANMALKQSLDQRYAALLQRYQTWNQQAQSYNSQYASKNMDPNSPEYAAGQAMLAQLSQALTSYNSDNAAFAADVATLVLAKPYSLDLDDSFAPSGSFLHDKLMSSSAFVKDKFKQLPDEAKKMTVQWVLAKINAGLQGEGLPPLTPDQSKGLADSLNTMLGKSCDSLGMTMCAQLQSSINDAASQPDAAALMDKLRGIQVPETPQGKMDMSWILGASDLTLNSNGKLGLNVNSSDVKDFASSLKTDDTKVTIKNLLSDATKLTINVSLSQADWKADFSGSMTFVNPAGQLKYNYNVGANILWKFGGSTQNAAPHQ
jgi:hypothetical protein